MADVYFIHRARIKGESEWKDILPGIPFARYRQGLDGQCEIDFFAVPAESYAVGCRTGAIAARLMLESIERDLHGDEPVEERVRSIAVDAAKCLAERCDDAPSRRGAAVGFLSVLDALVIDVVRRNSWREVVDALIHEQDAYLLSSQR